MVGGLKRQNGIQVVVGEGEGYEDTQVCTEGREGLSLPLSLNSSPSP